MNDVKVFAAHQEQKDLQPQQMKEADACEKHRANEA